MKKTNECDVYIVYIEQKEFVEEDDEDEQRELVEEDERGNGGLAMGDAGRY
jgi:hypothetical protein